MQANESLYVTYIYLKYLDRTATVDKLAPNSMLHLVVLHYLLHLIHQNIFD
jgi:hypothetical protein